MDVGLGTIKAVDGEIAWLKAIAVVRLLAVMG